MTTDDTTPKPKVRPGASAEGTRAKDQRADRLAAALKANLAKRKAAARAAAAGRTADDKPAAGEVD